MPHYLIRCGDALSQLGLRLFRTVQFNVWALWLLSLEAWDEHRRCANL